MKLWPFVSRSEYETVFADRERLRGERNQFEKDRNTQIAAARTATEKYADLYDKYTDTAIVNECLTEDLRKANERIAEFGVRRTVSDVLEEHDVHRKALADALGEQKRHLNWDQLIGEASRLTATAEERMADHSALEKRTASEEARLRAELQRSERARAALDEQCRVLQKANEADALELRELREGATS